MGCPPLSEADCRSIMAEDGSIHVFDLTSAILTCAGENRAGETHEDDLVVMQLCCHRNSEFPDPSNHTHIRFAVVGQMICELSEALFRAHNLHHGYPEEGPEEDAADA